MSNQTVTEETNKVPVSLRINPELKRKLDGLAAHNNRSLNNQVEVLLTAACAREEKRLKKAW
jgi:hypothetical protein